MKLLVILSALGLIAVEVGGFFTARFARWRKAAAALLGGLLLFGLAGMLFTKFLSDHASFERPAALLFLLVPLAVLLVKRLFRPVFARRFAYPLVHLQIEQTSLRILFTRWVPLGCYMLALVLLCVALARPMRIDRTVLPPTEGIDIMLVMDMSGSMENRDFYPSRFAAAQSVAERFVGKRPNDRIGLVVFGSYAMLQVPLTLDHDALEEHIRQMYLGMVDSNTTAIGDALAVGANHLKGSKAKSKVIILLTDGKSNAGAIEPLTAAKAAKSYGLRVYTVATASTPGQTLYSSDKDEIDEGLLMEIAKTTGGKFYRAKNEAELEQIYNTINELEKTAFAPSSLINRKDIYQPMLLLALLFALGAFVLEKLVLVKVP